MLVANLCEYYTTTRVEYHPDSPCSNFAINNEIMNLSGKGNYLIFLSSKKWRKFFHDSARGLILCSKKKILGVESRDFSQAEKEITACKAEQIHKMTTIFTQNSPWMSF